MNHQHLSSRHIDTVSAFMCSCVVSITTSPQFCSLLYGTTALYNCTAPFCTLLCGTTCGDPCIQHSSASSVYPHEKSRKTRHPSHGQFGGLMPPPAAPPLRIPRLCAISTTCAPPEPSLRPPRSKPRAESSIIPVRTPKSTPRRCC